MNLYPFFAFLVSGSDDKFSAIGKKQLIVTEISGRIRGSHGDASLVGNKKQIGLFRSFPQTFFTFPVMACPNSR